MRDTDDVANANLTTSDQAATGQTHVLTPDSAEGRSMSTAELWDYTKKVLVGDGKEPPKIEKLGALLNLSERTAKNVLWDVIIHTPTHVNSFIDRLVAEEIELAQRATHSPIQRMERNAYGMPQNKKRRHDYELQEHLTRLSFTTNQMPTFVMAKAAYRRAMTLDAIQHYERVRAAVDIKEIAKLRQESDENREAYTNAFVYIEAAIHAKTTTSMVKSWHPHGNESLCFL
tara:strand:- start:495 stop:1184 length:690 start_codon:yes stop_codon:yes gene_type:complete